MLLFFSIAWFFSVYRGSLLYVLFSFPCFSFQHLPVRVHAGIKLYSCIAAIWKGDNFPPMATLKNLQSCSYVAAATLFDYLQCAKKLIAPSGVCSQTGRWTRTSLRESAGLECNHVCLSYTIFGQGFLEKLIFTRNQGNLSGLT